MKLKRFKNISAPIKNQDDLDDFIANVERDTFYITFCGSIAYMDERITFSYKEVMENLSRFVKAAQKVYKETKKNVDKKEAFEILTTIQVMPLRLH